jgi:protein-S-isoprenylcysteine O-methyltransferase Ste14
MTLSPKSIASLTVAIQFVSAGAIFVGGPMWPTGWVARALLVASVLFMAWAVWVMRPGRFNVRPTVHPRAEMVARGPYRLIRHPMYLSVLVFFTVLVVARPTALRIGLWAVLLIDLAIKMRMEERSLEEAVAGYREYEKKTRRLVPWVF